MILRRFAQSDRPNIADIHCLSWQQSYRAHMPVVLLDEDLPDMMRSHWHAKDIRPEDAVFVAEDAGEIVGFVAAWDGEPVYLDNLHVRQAHRSRAIGRKLMGAVAAQAQRNGRAAVDLHVVMGNDRAKALYLAMGGTVTAQENKDLAGIAVPHYRISWPDLHVLLAKTGAGKREIYGVLP